MGEDSGLPDLVDRKLLSEVEIGADVDTEGFIRSLSNTLAKYFTYLPGVSAKGQKRRLKSCSKTLLRQKGRRIK